MKRSLVYIAVGTPAFIKYIERSLVYIEVGMGVAGGGRGGEIPPTFESGGHIVSFVPPTFLS